MGTKKESKLIRLIKSIMLVIIWVLVVPSLIKRFSSKGYKFSLENNKKDYQDIGPAIIKKEKMSDEN